MDEFYKVVAYILAGVLGVCVGSFLNVVIYRVPIGMSLAKPDSHCPKCNYRLRWYDNIPVFSYLILGGKCRNCKVHIPFRYTAVELANTVTWLLSVAMFWDENKVFAGVVALASSLLICVFFIDLEHMLVFDRFVILLLILGGVSTFVDPYYGWLSHVIGGAVGFLLLYGIEAFFYYVLKKDALGGGDIKLTGAVGLLLGWERLIFAMVIASVSACIILLLLQRKQGDETSEKAEEDGAKEYPFAPFLCTGFWVALTFGASVIGWYLSLFGM